MKAKRKYPPYPDASMDYSVRESARMALRKPNKAICVYCHGQALSEASLVDFHEKDCPAYLAYVKEAKVEPSTVGPRPGPDKLSIMVESGQRRRDDTRDEAADLVTATRVLAKAISRVGGYGKDQEDLLMIINNAMKDVEGWLGDFIKLREAMPR